MWDWLNQLGAGQGSVPFNPEERSGVEQFTFEAQEKQRKKMADLQKMMMALGSVQGGGQMTQAPQAQAPRIQAPQAQGFKSPYGGLMGKARPTAGAFKGLL